MKKYVWALLVASASWGVQVTLDGEALELRYPYQSVPQKEQSSILFVPQSFYVLPEKGQPVLIGPLSPCVMIALQNTQSQKTIVFHKHAENNIDDALKLALHALQIRNPCDLKGALYTATSENYTVSMPGLGGKTLQDLHQGRSQLEELKFLKDVVIKGFGCPDRRQVTATLFTPGKWGPAVRNAAGYSFRYILIEADMEPKCFCPFRERLFYNPNPDTSLFIRSNVTQEVSNHLCITMLSIFHGRRPGELVLSKPYGTQAFASATMGLYTRAKELLHSQGSIERLEKIALMKEMGLSKT